MYICIRVCCSHPDTVFFFCESIELCLYTHIYYLLLLIKLNFVFVKAVNSVYRLDLNVCNDIII